MYERYMHLHVFGKFFFECKTSNVFGEIKGIVKIAMLFPTFHWYIRDLFEKILAILF